MIVIASFFIGAVLGWYRAGRMNGNRKDRAQYATVFAIIFTLAGLFLTILIERSAA